ISSAIAHINASTNICLVQRTTQADYLVFQDSENSCWSYVGKIGGAQAINVHSACGFGAAVHEICHAAGMWHEQSRNDRDTYVTINTANIQSGYGSNFDKYGSWGTEAGAYDYGSIMHYGAYAFSSNGLPTISVKSPPAAAGTAIGQRGGLSGGDVAALNTIYPTVACDKGGGSTGGGSTGGGSTGGGGGGGVVVVTAPVLTMASEIRVDPVPIISDDAFSVIANFTNTGNAAFNGCIIMKLYKTGGQLLTKVSIDPSETLEINKSFSNDQIISSAGISLATGDYYVELWYEASCGSSEQEVNSTSTFSNKKEVKGLKIIPMLEVKPLDFNIEKEGGSKSIMITSNTVWNVTNNPSWLKFPTNRAFGNTDLIFSCDSNITFYPRNAKFNISATGTKTFDLSVKQNALPLSECVAPGGLKIVSKDYSWAKITWNPIRGTNHYQLRYKTLQDSIWISIDSIQGNTFDISNLSPCKDYLIQVSAYCANIKSPLSAQISFKTEGCDDPYCFSYGAGKSDWIETVTISDKSFTSGQNLGYTNKMDIIGNVEEGRIHYFRFASKHNALSKTDLYRWQLFIDFNGDKDFNDTLEQIYDAIIPKFTSVTGVFKNITIPEDMPLGVTRLRIVLSTDKAANGACEISPEILEVEDYGIHIKKNKDSIFITPDSVFLKNIYTTLRANVRASTGWDVTKRPSWVSTTHPSWAATPTGLNVSLFVSNNTGARRQFNYTYTLRGSVKTKAIFLSQDPAKPTLDIDTLTYSISDLAQTKSIPVKSNIYWRAKTNAFWIQVNNPLGLENEPLKLAILNNTNKDARTDTIRVFAASGDTLSKLILIKQAAKKGDLSVLPDALNFNSSATSQSIHTKGNLDWKVIAKPTWVQVNKNNGSANDSLKVTSDVNPNGSARNGKMLIQSVDETVRLEIKIFQDASPPLLKLSTRLVSIPDTSNQISLKLNSNIPWQLKSKPDWVREIQPFSDSSFQLRESTLKIMFESNPTYVSRKGVLVWKAENLIDSLVLLQDSKQINLPENWKLKPTNDIHQMLIFKNSTFNMGPNINIVPGDLIGLFVENGNQLNCAGFGIWRDENMVINVFGDNPATPDVEGYVKGAPFRFKIRPVNSSRDIEVLCQFSPIGSYGVVTATHSFLPGGVSAVETLFTLTSAKMDFYLNAGWNTISSYVIPEIKAFDYIVDWSKFPFVKSFENGTGTVYFADKKNANYPAFDIREGYKVFAENAGKLTLTGAVVKPSFYPIDIKKGLQIIPFYSFLSRPVAEVLKAVVNEIKLIKDNEGKVYIPELGINRLQQLNPGQGYHLQAKKDIPFFYPDQFVSGAMPPGIQHNPLTDSLEYYKLRNNINTGNNSTIAIRFTPQYLKKGDEIGLFANDTLLFGASKVDTGNIAITAWGNNQAVSGRNGFFENENIRIKLWRKSENKVYPLFINWEDNGDGKYRKDELLIGQIQSIATTSLFSQDYDKGVENIDIFPNPVSTICKVMAKEDVKGEIIITLWNEEGKSIQKWIFAKGILEDESVDISLSNFPSGNYLLRFSGKNIEGFKKLQIIR
ncbi:MAG: M12 family metallopeptidase, partial [Bacteroidota bacterium]